MNPEPLHAHRTLRPAHTHCILGRALCVRRDPDAGAGVQPGHRRDLLQHAGRGPVGLRRGTVRAIRLTHLQFVRCSWPLCCRLPCCSCGMLPSPAAWRSVALCLFQAAPISCTACVSMCAQRAGLRFVLAVSDAGAAGVRIRRSARFPDCAFAHGPKLTLHRTARCILACHPT